MTLRTPFMDQAVSRQRNRPQQFSIQVFAFMFHLWRLSCLGKIPQSIPCNLSNSNSLAPSTFHPLLNSPIHTENQNNPRSDCFLNSCSPLSIVWNVSSCQFNTTCLMNSDKCFSLAQREWQVYYSFLLRNRFLQISSLHL